MEEFKKERLKKSAYLFLTIIILLSMSLCVLFLPTKATAAELVVGNVNYDGSKNNCHYDVKISGVDIYGNVTSVPEFSVFMIGKYCTRNIFTTFDYNIVLNLSQNNVIVATETISFKIKDKDDVPENKRSIFSKSVINGSGTYLLTWAGTIVSNATAIINQSYVFHVA